MGKGHNFREPCIPFAPREYDGTLESAIKRKIAPENDDKAENLIKSVMKDNPEGFTYDLT